MSVSFEDFDPNNPDHLAAWMVYADGDSLKFHATRGPALNSLMSWTKSKLYENVGGRWELRAVKDVGSRHDTCDVCHKPGVQESYRNSSRYYIRGQRWTWKRKGAGGAIDDPLELLYICYPCRQALGL